VQITSSVIPLVSIAITSGTNPSCSGNLTFTASPTYGGATPAYQWKLNGSNVGTNSSVYSGTFADGDLITCEMTSSETCVSSSTATSNTITVQVTTSVTPLVSIAITSGTNPSCSGNLTFTASPTYGGATPAYQWKLNGSNVGTNSTVYSGTFANSDIITCEMTSSEICANPTTATSDAITVTVNGTLSPLVSISTPDTTICSGTSVTFTAIPTNGGSNPMYQWKVNGSNIGAPTTSNTYTTSSLLNNDKVSCILTSDALCVSPATATSDEITMIVNTVIVPSISITTSETIICPSTSVTFTATPTNGGSSPMYQWQVNGSDTGAPTTSNTYTTSSLLNNDKVSCILTSDALCVSSATATSNEITMNVNSVVVPSVSVTTPETTICPSTSVIFTATPTSGGTNPIYQWKVNGSDTGAPTTNNTYTTSSLVDNDKVSCVLTSNATCASPTTATSNEITITVNSTLIPSVSISTPETTICAGAFVTITATPTSGGTNPTYQWKINGSNIGTPTTINTYTTNSLANNDNISCVLISNATCASPTTATSNEITIVIIALPNAPTVSPSDTTICAGTSGTIHLSGGTSYKWYASPSGGSVAFTSGDNYAIPTILVTGVYTYYVSTVNANGCESTGRTEVIIRITSAIPNAPVVTPTTASICDGSTTTFALSGGSTYNWYTEPFGGTPFTSTGASYTTPTLTVGTHTYYVSSVNGCGESASRRMVTVTVNPIPSAPSVSPADTLICLGTSITLHASGASGATFKWYNSASGGTLLYSLPYYTTTPTGLTKYYVSQTVNGCESLARDSAKVDATVHYIGKTVNGSYCNGDAGYEYLGNIYTEGTWLNAITILSTTTACDTLVTLKVTKNPTYNINIYDTICYGDKILFNGTEYDTEGIYTVTLPTIYGCDSIVSLNLSIRKSCYPQIISAANDFYELTYGDAPFTFNVTASSGLPVIASDVSGTSADIQNVSVGTYSVTVRSVGTTIVTLTQAGNDYWASAERTITILVNPAQLIITADNYTVEFGAAYPTFTSTYSGFVYSENESVLIEYPQFYCSVTNTTTIGEFPIIVSGAEAANYVIEYQDGLLEVKGPTGSLPNAFTPYNQDGLNDIFGAGYELQIFNRWGARFYNGTDGWNGQYKGKLVAPGVYYYRAKDADGVEFRGSVMLVKPL
jgi:gliding motility-associated-like protein